MFPSWEMVLGFIATLVGGGSIGAGVTKYLDYCLARRKQDAEASEAMNKQCNEEDNVLMEKLAARVDTVEKALAASVQNEIECLKKHAETQREMGRLEGKVSAFEGELISLRGLVAAIQRPVGPQTVINQGPMAPLTAEGGEAGSGIHGKLAEGPK